MALGISTLMTKNVFAAIAVASVLLLTTGCGEKELNTGGAGSSGGGGSSNSDSNGKDDGKAKGDESKDSPAAVLEGKDCFPGNWLASNTDMQNYMETLSGGDIVAVTGNVFLTYNADGTSQTNYDRWTNSITIEGITSVVQRHGIDQGTYTLTADGVFTASDTSIGSLTTMTATIPGAQAVSMAIDPEPSVFSTAQYTCSGDLLTMQVDGYNLSLTRQG